MHWLFYIVLAVVSILLISALALLTLKYTHVQTHKAKPTPTPTPSPTPIPISVPKDVLSFYSSDSPPAIKVTDIPDMSDYDSPYFDNVEAKFILELLQNFDYLYKAGKIVYGDRDTTISAITKTIPFFEQSSDRVGTVTELLPLITVDLFGNEIAQWGGYFLEIKGQNNNTSTVIALIGGTETEFQGHMDNMSNLVLPSWANKKVFKVHSGFSDLYSNPRVTKFKTMREVLNSKIDYYLTSTPLVNVVIAGFAQGGAVAQLNAADMAIVYEKALTKRANLQYFCFGTPLVGNADFVTLAQSVSSQPIAGENYSGIFNVLNVSDPISQYQFSEEYAPVIIQNFCFDIPNKPHSFEAYLTGLDKYGDSLETNGKFVAAAGNTKCKLG